MSDEANSPRQSTILKVLRLLGLFLLLPAFVLFMETVALPLSAVGRIYVLSLVALTVGCALLLRWPRAGGVVIAASLLVTFGMLFVRAAWTGAYDAHDDSQGNVSSPLIKTVISSQSPESFDLVFFSAESDEADKGALIFLHGFAGNWSLLCWIVAEATATRRWLKPLERLFAEPGSEFERKRRHPLAQRHVSRQHVVDDVGCHLRHTPAHARWAIASRPLHDSAMTFVSGHSSQTSSAAPRQSTPQLRESSNSALTTAGSDANAKPSSTAASNVATSSRTTW